MENIFWTGYSHQERTTAIPGIQKLVATYGDLVDFKLFSDIAVTLTIEIEELRIDLLYDELKKSISLDAFTCLHSTAKRERTVFLNVTFSKATGNLTIDTPAVPG